MSTPRLYTRADLEAFLGMELPLRDRVRENESLDFKVKCSDTLPKAVCAFANGAGGTVLIGVAEADGGPDAGGLPDKIVGIPTPHESALFIANKLTAIDPAPRVRVHAIEVGAGKSVVVIVVAAGVDAPYFYNEGATHRALVRVGPQCVDAPRSSIVGMVGRLHGTAAGPAFDTWFTNLPVFRPHPNGSGNPQAVPDCVRIALGRLPRSTDGVVSAADEADFREHINRLAPMLMGAPIFRHTGPSSYSFTATATSLVSYPRWRLEADGSVFCGLCLRSEGGPSTWSAADIVRASARVVRVAAEWLEPTLDTFEDAHLGLFLSPNETGFTPASLVGGPAFPAVDHDPQPIGSRPMTAVNGGYANTALEHTVVDLHRGDLAEALALVWLRSLRQLHGVSANHREVTAFVRAEMDAPLPPHGSVP